MIQAACFIEPKIFYRFNILIYASWDEKLIQSLGSFI